MTAAPRGTHLVLGEPLLQVRGVPPVSADDAAVRGPPHRYVTDHAVQRQPLAVRAAAVLRRFEAVLAVGEELDAPVHVRGAAHVLEHLGALVQQAPAVQRLRVGQLVVFVEGVGAAGLLRDRLDAFFEKEVVQGAAAGRADQGEHPAVGYHVGGGDRVVWGASSL